MPAEVKALRTRLGMTQVQFARELGIALSTVTHWEQGRRHPAGLYLRALETLAQRPTPSQAPEGES